MRKLRMGNLVKRDEIKLLNYAITFFGYEVLVHTVLFCISLLI